MFLVRVYSRSLLPRSCISPGLHQRKQGQDQVPSPSWARLFGHCVRNIFSPLQGCRAQWWLENSIQIRERVLPALHTARAQHQLQQVGFSPACPLPTCTKRSRAQRCASLVPPACGWQGPRYASFPGDFCSQHRWLG